MVACLCECVLRVVACFCECVCVSGCVFVFEVVFLCVCVSGCVFV